MFQFVFLFFFWMFRNKFQVLNKCFNVFLYLFECLGTNFKSWISILYLSKLLDANFKFQIRISIFFNTNFFSVRLDLVFFNIKKFFYPFLVLDNYFKFLKFFKKLKRTFLILENCFKYFNSVFLINLIFILGFEINFLDAPKFF